MSMLSLFLLAGELVKDDWKFPLIMIMFIALMLVSLNHFLENRSVVNGIVD